MMDTQTLPMAYEFIAISRIVEGYPATIEEMIWTARTACLAPELIRFLYFFPPKTVFKNPDDFTDRAMALSLLMQQESYEPLEYLRSPQD